VRRVFGSESPRKVWVLLEFDACAGFLELLLELFGFLFGDTLFDGGGSLFDGSFGLFESQTGDGADDLDDVNLLRTGRGQNDVEFGLLFGRLGCCAGAAATTVA
jgi:hypothetical protein